ncbi:hypothetical protein DF186_11065 [Enterococcus hirae]|uniref:ZmpA/ZmpB/ZmpC family metallo-endopeptidase n=1 Tax=Enterococcus hirae TaxID=1354 RepID=UPI000D6699E9|nr:hypothetical protein DF186_11065 [Enterococcus hirae]
MNNSVVNRRYYGGASVSNNSYYESSMYASNYSTLQNSNGTFGGIIFRKIVYELLSAKGWTVGFVHMYLNNIKNKLK